LNIIVALNKSDIIKQEDLENSKQLIQLENYPQVISTYITSAKTGHKVDEMFQLLAHRMLEEQLLNREA
jgi:50S ribosomal subunit-associated GTPase HflX